ncbi:MAG: malonate decarboxylase holo-[acyl-carrier-protein] synthase [Stenotrophomonas sp.]
MPDHPARHTLVWLPVHAGWRADVAAHEPRLSAWFAQGLPAMVARRAADDPDPRLRLGVPLPPAEGKQRLALRVARQDIGQLQAPPALSDVLAAAGCRIPLPWHAPLLALAALAPARVFGAFAWQHLTGLDYVQPRSDIDLLWQVADAAQADALVAQLQAWEARHPHRIDGELCLVDGGAVNWREYAGCSREVLVKRIDGAALEPRASLFNPARVAA